jgi:hypothetical protein
MPTLPELSSLKWWAPTLQEMFVFLIIVVVMFIWAMLVHYSVINNKVKAESRCLKEARLYRRGAVYSVGAYDSTNAPLYSVSYDLNNKEYKHTCACTPGKFSNQFSIDVYDQKKNKADKVTKLCNCDKKYELDDPTFDIYYQGFPGLIDFMNNPKNTTLFNNSSMQGQRF